MSHTLQQTVVICNPQGFHMRPKAAFARLAGDYQSDVRLSWNGQSFDGKSMWALMGVAAEQGQSVIVEVNGPDADQALPALVAVLCHPGEDSAAPGPAPPSITNS
jgi:phosphotransferase system HPr (HPr) family protein